MTNRQNKKTAIVVGGSVAGLFAGNLLWRDGWSVEVCERASGNLESRGAGIGTHDELFDAMRQAGARVDEMIGIQVIGRAAYDHAGEEIARFDYPQYLTSWGLLYRRLRAALPDEVYHLGKDVVEVSDGDDRATVSFADGSRENADLVIGADGSWSTVRAQCNPAEAPRYCGYFAWRGLIDETEMSDAFRDRYAKFLNFYMGDDHQLICYPVAGADDSVAPGRRRFSFLWYRPYDEESELPLLLTDADGIRHEHQISPLRIDPKHIARMRQEASRLLPPDFADFLRRVPKPFLQPIYDVIPSRIAFRRVALVGDAACVARPHVGAGVAKAATDATTLAASLRTAPTIAEALCEFERLRMPFGHALVERGRYLGAYLEAPRPSVQRTPVLPTEEIIRESAMLLHSAS